jgi:hypothetical protein
MSGDQDTAKWLLCKTLTLLVANVHNALKFHILLNSVVPQDVRHSESVL